MTSPARGGPDTAGEDEPAYMVDGKIRVGYAGAWRYIDVGPDTAGMLVALSQWIDGHNAHRAPEANLWSRVTKAAEEIGEATTALRGAIGENPRKGVIGSLDDVVEELLDTAVAALGAVEHIRDHDGQALALLDDKIRRVHARALPCTCNAWRVHGVEHADDCPRALAAAAQPTDGRTGK